MLSAGGRSSHEIIQLSSRDPLISFRPTLTRRTGSSGRLPGRTLKLPLCGAEGSLGLLIRDQLTPPGRIRGVSRTMFCSRTFATHELDKVHRKDFLQVWVVGELCR